MRTKLSVVSILLLVTILGAGLACSGRRTPALEETPGTAAAAAALATNPLLQEWTGPYGGVPAFGRMELEDLEPAFDAAIAETLREIDAIADNPEPPTFENTIVAMERTGDALDRLRPYYAVWTSNISSPEVREVQRRVSPKLAELGTRVTQNEALFERIAAVHDGPPSLEERDDLRPDQKRLIELVYDRFARNGATLDGAAKERYAEINQRLAELYTRFANNVLADEEGYVLYLDESQ
ncbi:MAG: M3 family peptidase, partial [Acidobacteriota bacterium]